MLLSILSGDVSSILTVQLTVTHRNHWSSDFGPVKATYFFASSMPTAFVVLPPKRPTPSGERPRPPILALRESTASGGIQSSSIVIKDVNKCLMLLI